MGLALAIDFAVKALVLALSLYPIMRPESAHFAGKAMGARAVLYVAVMVLIPSAWLVAGRPEPYPFVADIALGIPLLVDAAGNVFGLFSIKGFDAIPHLTGWFFLSVAFGLAVSPLLPEPWVAFGLVLGFGAAIDVLWEISEYLLMRSGASGLDLTYENTIQGPGDVARGGGAGSAGCSDHPVAGTRDTGVTIRLGLMQSVRTVEGPGSLRSSQGVLAPLGGRGRPTATQRPRLLPGGRVAAA